MWRHAEANGSRWAWPRRCTSVGPDCSRPEAHVDVHVPCEAAVDGVDRTVHAVAAPASCLPQAHFDLAASANATETSTCPATPARRRLAPSGRWRAAAVRSAYAAGVVAVTGAARPCLWNERPEGGNFTGMAYEACLRDDACAVRAYVGKKHWLGCCSSAGLTHRDGNRLGTARGSGSVRVGEGSIEVPMPPPACQATLTLHLQQAVRERTTSIKVFGHRRIALTRHQIRATERMAANPVTGRNSGRQCNGSAAGRVGFAECAAVYGRRGGGRERRAAAPGGIGAAGADRRNGRVARAAGAVAACPVGMVCNGDVPSWPLCGRHRQRRRRHCVYCARTYQRWQREPSCLSCLTWCPLSLTGSWPPPRRCSLPIPWRGRWCRRRPQCRRPRNHPRRRHPRRCPPQCRRPRNHPQRRHRPRSHPQRRHRPPSHQQRSHRPRSHQQRSHRPRNHRPRSHLLRRLQQPRLQQQRSRRRPRRQLLRRRRRIGRARSRSRSWRRRWAWPSPCWSS